MLNSLTKNLIADKFDVNNKELGFVEHFEDQANLCSMLADLCNSGNIYNDSSY